MRNCFFLITVMLAAGAGLAACSDDDSSSSPLQPSPLATAPATPAATQSGAPSVLPARFDAPAGAESSLAPDAISGFNAYDFEAAWDGSMLSLALIEDEMRSMREASKPHRNRRITVETCPVEPHHALQACGDPIWTGTRRLAGRLELPPVPLASCEGWIVVNAAELSDDGYDGWRNAPCPNPDGESVVGSDGTGEGWPAYPEPEPEAGTNGAPVIVNPGNREYGRGETITPFFIGVRDADGDTVAVQVTGLPAGLSWSPAPGQVSGTVAADAAARDYTVTVTADDGVNEAVTGDFTITVVPVWILLADSLTVSRLGGTYTGDGPDGGGWPIRWARWYYAEFEPGWTIVQVYVASPGSWAGAGRVGCQVETPPPSMVWNAYKSSMTNGAELLGSEAPVRFRDGAGNPTSRVPAGYDDDPARLWTFRFPRTDSTHTRFLTSCQGAAATTGLLHFHNVPLPPSSP